MLLAIFVSAISADVAEKLTDEKSATATNAEGSAKEKRGIHFHSYSAPYVYHSPVVVHHAAPIIHHSAPIYHSAPIIHHSAPIIHHSYVATHAIHTPIISHAPLVAVHHFKRR